MAWKQKREQYLLNITDEFAEDWRNLKDGAKNDSINVSEALRNAVI